VGVLALDQVVEAVAPVAMAMAMVKFCRLRRGDLASGVCREQRLESGWEWRLEEVRQVEAGF
jgi:hypothetical protein